MHPRKALALPTSGPELSFQQHSPTLTDMERGKEEGGENDKKGNWDAYEQSILHACMERYASVIHGPLIC